MAMLEEKEFSFLFGAAENLLFFPGKNDDEEEWGMGQKYGTIQQTNS